MTKKKAVVFIDGSNMFYLQKKLGWVFDWSKVNKYLNDNYQVVRINFYEPYKDSLKAKQEFFDFLRKQGINVITKPVKFIVDSLTGKTLPKANFDVEITRDILLEILHKKTNFKCFILFSGDSDFGYLVKDIKKLFDKKIIVFAGRKNLSWELRTAADSSVYLEDLKSEVFRRDWGLTKDVSSGKVKVLYRRRSKRPAIFVGKKYAKKN